MSHQSGIPASEELLEIFKRCLHENNTRLIKVSIEDEKLVSKNEIPVAGTWEEDFPKIVEQMEENVPCYVLYRLDSQRSGEYSWSLICYVPDTALVRLKMLYASTRATLKRSLGDNRFDDEVYGNTKEDFTMEAFLKHRESVQAAPVLTEREQRSHQMKTDEARAEVGITTKKAHVHGVYFPLSDEAETQLNNFKNETINYVQLAIDMKNETIELEDAKTATAGELNGFTPKNHPRYHLFRFRHTFQDNTLDLNIFVYSCPMESPVKERMLYSSCKSAVLQVAGELVGITIDKNSEVSDPEEFTEQFIFEELHPKKPEEKKAFKKPMRPGRNTVRK